METKEIIVNGCQDCPFKLIDIYDAKNGRIQIICNIEEISVSTQNTDIIKSRCRLDDEIIIVRKK